MACQLMCFIALEWFVLKKTLIVQEIRRRGLKVAVVGIPKTIDNDIPVLDMNNF